MSSRLKVNSTIFLLLAGLFVFATLNLNRLRVPAFGLDSCDAVMHFAVFNNVVCPHWLATGIAPISGRHLRDARNLCPALAAFVAFVAHAIVLARHPSMWVSADWRNQLLGWLGVFAAVPVAMEFLVLVAQPTRTEVESTPYKGAVLACLLALAALAFCPEYGIDIVSETAHILTVIVGGLVVLVPIAYLLPVLVPHQSGRQRGDKTFFNTSSERRALLIGILMGSILFWIDAHRTGSVRPLLPVLKLVGPIMGLVIVYAFFAEQLGLTSQNRVNRVAATSSDGAVSTRR